MIVERSYRAGQEAAQPRYPVMEDAVHGESAYAAQVRSQAQLYL